MADKSSTETGSWRHDGHQSVSRDKKSADISCDKGVKRRKRTNGVYIQNNIFIIKHIFELSFYITTILF